MQLYVEFIAVVACVANALFPVNVVNLETNSQTIGHEFIEQDSIPDPIVPFIDREIDEHSDFLPISSVVRNAPVCSPVCCTHASNPSGAYKLIQCCNCKNQYHARAQCSIRIPSKRVLAGKDTWLCFQCK